MILTRVRDLPNLTLIGAYPVTGTVLTLAPLEALVKDLFQSCGKPYLSLQPSRL